MNGRGWGEVFRFGIVGIANSAFGLCVIYACKYALMFSDIAANATGYLCGLCLSFLLNSRWTFASRGRGRSPATKFAAAFLIAYAANLAVTFGWMKTVPDLADMGHVAGFLVYTGLFFLLSKSWVFRAG